MKETLSCLESRLIANLQRALPVDALYLSLHGASAADDEPDVEGFLLTAVRRVVGPGIPIVASLDHHANVTRRMLEHLDGIVAHRTQPHDPFDTGRAAATQLLAILDGEMRPTVAWRKIPMLAHQEQFATDRGPMKAWFGRAREYEAEPAVVSVSPFPMQPWLDVPEAGWSTVVVTDDDAGLAEEIADQHARQAWAMRQRFMELGSVSVEVAVRQAISANGGMVLLSDIGDSVLGGAPGDSAHILAELLRQRTRKVALVPIVDPAVVEQAITAGIGHSISTRLGGTLAPEYHEPVAVRGIVAGIRSGRVRVDVVGFGSFDMGRTVLLESGPLRVVVSEQAGVGGVHPVVFRRFDVEPTTAGMVVVKTAANFQHYEGLASAIIHVDSPGPTGSHLERFRWRHVPRPIYPLDDGVELRPQARVDPPSRRRM